ncbi:ComF family protein [Paenibacillus harenae]|uniref:ComF family protein n=1 Tax=Paenibacillus harenae TaxID=306543 RepID=UPI0003F9E9AC|nr:ComF family protein [Paenibacillus harenae]
MIVSPTSWLQRLRAAFTASTQLLAPHSAACLICGKTQPAARSADNPNHPKLPAGLRNSVCGACLSAIPWLTRIQCPKCGRGIRCDDCVRSPHRSFVCNRSAVQYDPMMRALLAQYKYRGNEQLEPLLGAMLLPAFELLTSEIAYRSSKPAKPDSRRKIPFRQYWDAIVYVPISRERARDRGFNQAEQLAAHIAQRYDIPLLDLLVRARHTEKQSFKTRSERLKDTRQLFEINPMELHRLHKDRLAGPNHPDGSRGRYRILLIDDIYTTGSTSEACSRTLLQQSELPFEIYVLTWARS